MDVTMRKWKNVRGKFCLFKICSETMLSCKKKSGNPEYTFVLWFLPASLRKQWTLVFQDGGIGRPGTPLFPRHNKSTTTHRTIFSKKDTKTSWTAPSQQRTKRPHWDRWGRDMEPPLVLWSTGERDLTNMKNIPEEWGVSPISDTPTLRTCTGEMSPQNIWLWKPTGLNVQDTQKTVGKYDSTLKGHMNSDSLVLAPSAKGASWKRSS